MAGKEFPARFPLRKLNRKDTLKKSGLKRLHQSRGAGRKAQGTSRRTG